MAYTYPTEYDSADGLLALLGEFWESLHQDATVLYYAGARGQAELQAVNNFDELQLCASRVQMPVFHVTKFFPLTIAQSTGQPGPFIGSRQWPGPSDLAMTSLLAECPVNTVVALVDAIDYDIDSDFNVVFRTDPFLNPRIPQIPVYNANGDVIDTQIQLWFSRPQFDNDIPNEQYGYAINFQLPASQTAKDLINEYLDAVVSGTAKEQVERAISLLVGIPLVFNDNEVVEVITSDATSNLIMTDRSVYRTPFGSVTLVAVNDVVMSGQALCDALQFFDCNRGQVPTAAQCPGVVLDPGLTDLTIPGPLIFQNTSLPVIVTTSLAKTKIELALGGAPADVAQFWTIAHLRGIALGDTLAELMDTRLVQIGQPAAVNLPATLNPLQLLTQNILRYSGRLCVTKSPLFPSSTPGIAQGTFLRRIIPPNELVLIVDVTAPGVFTTTNAAAI
jgi:hypothetical protein